MALFPPIVDTYIPAFIRPNAGIIQFKLSPYAAADDYNLNLVQITISNQQTNKSMLNLTKYPNEIKIMAATLTEDNYYQVKIESTDLKEGNFQLNTYYKVQLRLTAAAITDTTGIVDGSPSSTWLAANQDNFSEWSTVALLRAISYPIVNIAGVTDNTLTVSNLIGNITFHAAEETETINNYSIIVYDTSGKIVEESGKIYPDINNKREIYYIFKTNLADINGGKVAIFFITDNGYKFNVKYNIAIDIPQSNNHSEIIDIAADEENGLFKLTLSLGDIGKNVIIKRADSRTNFSQWYDVYTYLNSSTGNFVWLDKSIESGVWYKYGIQVEQDDIRSIINKYNPDNPIMITFEHIYIVGDGGRQLKVKFNPSVGYKRNVQETQVVTLGSRYPFIRRNSAVNYKQFSISGLIHSISDSDLIGLNSESIERGRLFTSPSEIYGGEDTAALYSKYNSDNNVTKYNDIIYEREFREKAILFLMNGKPKLLRTHPEGNAIVNIMNVSLTPDTVSGRNLYSFSCDAYEIMDNTTENYASNNILDTFVKISEEAT